MPPVNAFDWHVAQVLNGLSGHVAAADALGILFGAWGRLWLVLPYLYAWWRPARFILPPASPTGTGGDSPTPPAGAAALPRPPSPPSWPCSSTSCSPISSSARGLSSSPRSRSILSSRTRPTPRSPATTPPSPSPSRTGHSSAAHAGAGPPLRPRCSPDWAAFTLATTGRRTFWAVPPSALRSPRSSTAAKPPAPRAAAPRLTRRAAHSRRRALPAARNLSARGLSGPVLSGLGFSALAPSRSSTRPENPACDAQSKTQPGRQAPGPKPPNGPPRRKKTRPQNLGPCSSTLQGNLLGQRHGALAPIICGRSPSCA